MLIYCCGSQVVLHTGLTYFCVDRRSKIWTTGPFIMSSSIVIPTAAHNEWVQNVWMQVSWYGTSYTARI